MGSRKERFDTKTIRRVLQMDLAKSRADRFATPQPFLARCAISQGKLAPVTAMMSGRLRLSDMGVAANLQGRMLALFSKMQAAS